MVASIRDISSRRDLQQKLRETADFNTATLASLQDHIAVVSPNGHILSVNRAWTQFAHNNGAGPDLAIGEGIDYFDACRSAAAQGSESAREALAGIQSVLDGTRSSFSAEYACDSPETERWFVMTVLALQSSGGGVIISHTDITRRKTAEHRLQNALDEVKSLKDRLRMENTYLQEEIQRTHNFEEIVGTSDELKLTLQKVEHVSPTDANTIILGETGTGKELIARAIHDRSERRNHPLVKVNCAALPGTLIESELFGHIKGAFTGAGADRTGRFELADGGTLFLDEVGELPLELQSKLLRVLQDGEFERLGSPVTQKVDVRVIAATNRDLSKAMNEGTFRADLYYRLAVFPVEVPPLRVRRRDIPLLVWHFIEKKQTTLSRKIERIPDPAMDALMQYDWPGNIRELENVVERAMILSPGSTLVLDDLFLLPAEQRRSRNPRQSLEEIERTQISEILEECHWKIKGDGNAAERLGLKPSTLRYRMNRLGIERPPKRPR